MEATNSCVCCLLRPADKDIKTPYTSLGITEIYSDMIEGCFTIQLSLEDNEECGICEECVGRLRDARDFKLQVQHSQLELQARRESALQTNDDETIKPEITDDERSDNETYEAPPVKTEADETLEDGDLISNEEPALKLESEETTEEDCISLPCLGAAPTPLEPGRCLSGRAKKQLSMTCSVRLERLRDDKMPHACLACHLTFNHEASLATHMRDAPRCGIRVVGETYACDTCGKHFVRKNSLIKHLHKHINKKEMYPLACETCSKQFSRKSDLKRHRRIHAEKLTYICDVIDKKHCSRKYDLRVHLRKHTGQKPYSYEVCSKTFGYSSSLRVLKRIHTMDKAPHACRTCPHTCVNAGSLATHMRDVHGDLGFCDKRETCLCDICGKRFMWKCSLIAHIKTHMNQKPKSCKKTPREGLTEGNLNKLKAVEKPKKTCEVCNKQFSMNSQLKKHKKIHSGIKPFVCDICKRCYTAKSTLITHILTHTGEKPHSCEYCDLKFITKYQLTIHRRRHTGEKPYTCEVCNVKFSQKQYLDSHKRIHSREKAFSDSERLHDDKAPHACPSCSHTCDNAGSLATHMRDVHGDLGFCDKRETCLCDICGKRFMWKCSLIAHIKTHMNQKPKSCKKTPREGLTEGNLNKPIAVEKPKKTCEVCNKQFSMNSQLKRHKKIHSGIKPFVCDICKRCYTAKSTLNTHKLTHTGEKPHSCEYCDLKFITKYQLTIHRRRHTGEKPYTCEVCNVKFSLKKYLRNHSRRHTGERPFSCEVCNQRFAQQFTLAVHKRTHTAEKPFNCGKCQQQFRYKTDYTQHVILTHAGVKPFACEICKKQFAQQRYVNLHIKNMHTNGKRSPPKVCNNKNKCDADAMICDICGKRYLSKDKIRNHIITQHMRMKLYFCKVCDKKFYNYSRFQQHKLVHTGDKLLTGGLDANGKPEQR